MTQSLLHKIGFKENIVDDDMQAQALSAKLVDTSVLTLTTVEAKTVVPKLIPPSPVECCEGRKIHGIEGGTAKNRWYTQTSSKSKTSKEFVFLFVDVFFLHGLHILIMYP
jgi:hypothetical protein